MDDTRSQIRSTVSSLNRAQPLHAVQVQLPPVRPNGLLNNFATVSTTLVTETTLKQQFQNVSAWNWQHPDKTTKYRVEVWPENVSDDFNFYTHKNTSPFLQAFLPEFLHATGLMWGRTLLLILKQVTGDAQNANAHTTQNCLSASSLWLHDFFNSPQSVTRAL